MLLVQPHPLISVVIWPLVLRSEEKKGLTVQVILFQISSCAWCIALLRGPRCHTSKLNVTSSPYPFQSSVLFSGKTRTCITYCLYLLPAYAGVSPAIDGSPIGGGGGRGVRDWHLFPPPQKKNNYGLTSTVFASGSFLVYFLVMKSRKMNDPKFVVISLK